MKQIENKSNCRINKVEVTTDTLTGRGGMVLFVRYIERAGIFTLPVNSFGYIRRSRKGASIPNIFKQVMCFLYDGTSRRLTYFDELKKDEGYAAIKDASSAAMALNSRCNCCRRLGTDLPHRFRQYHRHSRWYCLPPITSASLPLRLSEPRRLERSSALPQPF